jgi:hypothetical protein
MNPISRAPLVAVRHLPTTQPAPKRDVNQEDDLRAAYGDPDREVTNADAKPRPDEIWKRLTYDAEHVRIIMGPNDDVGRYYIGLVTCWVIVGYQDSETNKGLTEAAVEERLRNRAPDADASLNAAGKLGRTAANSRDRGDIRSRASSGTVHVDGYTRKDGTYVHGYDRASPGPVTGHSHNHK